MNQAALERTMRESWDGLVSRAGFSSSANQTLDKLIAAYSGAERHYHNLLHIHECLDLTQLIPKPFLPFDAVTTAIWFHDVVYEPRAHDNESRSAEFAASELKSLDAKAEFIKTVGELILNTEHRHPPVTEAGQFVVDIDLAILGSGPQRFDEYERGIRSEYAHVADADFRTGRAAILKRFILRDSIYMTAPFRNSFETQARMNLQRSLRHLEGDSAAS